MIGEVRHLLSVLRGRIPYRLVCSLLGCERRELTRGEAAIYRAHGKLLCPCGGELFSADLWSLP